MELSTPDHFMRGEDGYARHMAWQASERASAGHCAACGHLPVDGGCGDVECPTGLWVGDNREYPDDEGLL